MAWDVKDVVDELHIKQFITLHLLPLCFYKKRQKNQIKKRRGQRTLNATAARCSTPLDAAPDLNQRWQDARQQVQLGSPRLRKLYGGQGIHKMHMPVLFQGMVVRTAQHSAARMHSVGS
jgi:cytolysin (calcineurin-like family phosphatase)